MDIQQYVEGCRHGEGKGGTDAGHAARGHMHAVVDEQRGVVWVAVLADRRSIPQRRCLQAARVALRTLAAFVGRVQEPAGSFNALCA